MSDLSFLISGWSGLAGKPPAEHNVDPAGPVIRTKRAAARNTGNPCVHDAVARTAFSKGQISSALCRAALQNDQLRAVVAISVHRDYNPSVSSHAALSSSVSMLSSTSHFRQPTM